MKCIDYVKYVEVSKYKQSNYNKIYKAYLF